MILRDVLVLSFSQIYKHGLSESRWNWPLSLAVSIKQMHQLYPWKPQKMVDCHILTQPIYLSFLQSKGIYQVLIMCKMVYENEDIPDMELIAQLDDNSRDMIIYTH